MKHINFFAPFAKVNSDEQTVEGFASTEAVDSQGEIVKSSALEKALPDYMKFANIREMHQWSAVGKAVDAQIGKDGKKGLYLTAKVVDPVAWQKCKDGVYNGFSIGGKVLKRMGNEIQELILNEISLVDRPACPEAVFSMVKISDGIKKKKMKKQKKVVKSTEVPMDEAPVYSGIRVADQLIAMCTQMTYLKQSLQEYKMPVKHIDDVIGSLKKAAMFELENEKNAVEKKWREEQAKQQDVVNKVKEIFAKKTQNIEAKDWNSGYFNNMNKVL